MKSKSTKSLSTGSRKPIRSADVLVTAKMLNGVRDQLIKRMDKQFDSMNANIHGARSEFHGLKSVIHEVKSEVHGLKSEIHEVKSEFHGLRSDIHGVKEEVHRLAILVEEQNARNIFVLDGLTALFDRQDRLEKQCREKR